jgi:cytochrome b561
MTQTNPTAPRSYDTRTIVFHWLTFALVFGLWLVGENIDNFAKGDPRVYVRSLHIVFGLLLAYIIVRRLLWRRKGGAQLAPAGEGTQAKLAKGMHHLLYALLFAVVIAGIGAELIRGDNIFNLFALPSIAPGNKALRHDAVELHGLLVNILLLAAALHGAAAIWHQCVTKDNLIARMVPWLNKQ